MSRKPITEETFIQRVIPKISSSGSGHVGVSLEDLTEIFMQQFGKAPTEALNEMIKNDTITVTLTEWARVSYSSVPKSIQLLEEIPNEIPKDKRLRIFLSNKVWRLARAKINRRKKLRKILKEINK